MAVKKSGLGRGLDSLIPPTGNEAGESISDKKRSNTTTTQRASRGKKETTQQVDIMQEPVKIKITKIEPNREQPRKQFDDDALLELSESIKQFGIIQPILVIKKDDYFEIIAGERRWRAAKLAGLKEIPVIIRDYTEQEVVEISLIENIQRENLNPVEEAFAYKRLLEEFNLKQDEVAERVSKSRTAVTNSMRLLKLPEAIHKMLIGEMISSGHARALLSLSDESTQIMVADRIFDEKLSVRETEKLVKSLLNQSKKPVKKEALPLTAIYENLEENMRKVLGTKVAVHRINDKKGRIEIEYFSQEELERIYDLIKSIE
ncbi:MAG: ParB/RepB/Spo0J family partition protein [Lachnospiraceae bacterium]